MQADEYQEHSYEREQALLLLLLLLLWAKTVKSSYAAAAVVEQNTKKTEGKKSREWVNKTNNVGKEGERVDVHMLVPTFVSDRFSMDGLTTFGYNSTVEPFDLEVGGLCTIFEDKPHYCVSKRCNYVYFIPNHLTFVG